MTKIVTYSKIVANLYINSSNCINFTKINNKYTLYLK